MEDSARSFIFSLCTIYERTIRREMSTFVFGAGDGASQGDERQLHEALLGAVRLGWAGRERVTKLIQDGAKVDLAETVRPSPVRRKLF